MNLCFCRHIQTVSAITPTLAAANTTTLPPSMKTAMILNKSVNVWIICSTLACWIQFSYDHLDVEHVWSLSGIWTSWGHCWLSRCPRIQIDRAREETKKKKKNIYTYIYIEEEVWYHLIHLYIYIYININIYIYIYICIWIYVRHAHVYIHIT